MSIFIVYGFDTAGSFGEETIDASRQAPRGVLSSIWLSGLVGVDLPAGGPAGDPGHPGDDRRGPRRRLPDRRRPSPRNLTTELVAGITFGELYLLVILVSVFVCTLAIQGAATRMMFSMGRDRQLPLGGVWGHVNPTFKTPANAAVAVGVLAAIPILVTGPFGGFVAVDRRDRAHLPELPAVQPRRARGPATRLAAPEGVVQPRALGHAHQHPGHHLRRRDHHQHRALGATRLFGDFGDRQAADHWNPLDQLVPAARSARRSTGCRRGRCSRPSSALLLVFGGLYYAVAIRGRATRASRPTPRPARRPSADHRPNTTGGGCGAASDRRAASCLR